MPLYVQLTRILKIIGNNIIKLNAKHYLELRLIKLVLSTFGK